MDRVLISARLLWIISNGVCSGLWIAGVPPLVRGKFTATKPCGSKSFELALLSLRGDPIEPWLRPHRSCFTLSTRYVGSPPRELSPLLRGDTANALHAVANLGRVSNQRGVLPSPTREVLAGHATLALLLAAIGDAARLHELSLGGLWWQFNRLSDPGRRRIGAPEVHPVHRRNDTGSVRCIRCWLWCSLAT